MHNIKIESGVSHRKVSTNSDLPKYYTGEQICKCHQGIMCDKVGTHSQLACVQQVIKKSFKVVQGIFYKRVSTFTNLSLDGKKISKLVQNMSYKEVSTYTRSHLNFS